MTHENKIKDLPAPFRHLAVKRILDQQSNLILPEGETVHDWFVAEAFRFDKTPEGQYFWMHLASEDPKKLLSRIIKKTPVKYYPDWLRSIMPITDTVPNNRLQGAFAWELSAQGPEFWKYLWNYQPKTQKPRVTRAYIEKNIVGERVSSRPSVFKYRVEIPFRNEFWVAEKNEFGLSRISRTKGTNIKKFFKDGLNKRQFSDEVRNFFNYKQ